MNPLDRFHPAVRTWFERAYGTPTPPQTLGWPSIAAGQHTLILAPTGSGKTLAAFLWGINHLVEQRTREELQPGVRILYVSPLKALNNDIHRNLEDPLRGIEAMALEQERIIPVITTAIRTGDTPQSRRAAMLRKPPDILITTPESLYLMLTSPRTRKLFRTVQYVIVDEIHSICTNKRGVHLSLSLERLERLSEIEPVRIGLSATQRPLERVAAFLGGQRSEGRELVPRPVTIIDAGQKKNMDLRVECPAPDLTLLPQESVWPMLFAQLTDYIRSHNTTLIFVNNRRLAERVAAKLNEMFAAENDGPAVAGKAFGLYAVPIRSSREERRTSPSPPLENVIHVKAYHGSMSRQAREEMEEDLKAGRVRALVSTSSLELGIDIGSIDLVVQIQSPKGIARGLQRVGRSGHLISATSKGRILPTHREDLVESALVAGLMSAHEVEMTRIPENCLDVLAQQVVAMVSVEEWNVDDLYRCVRQSRCYQDLSERLFLGVLHMLAGRYTDSTFRDLRPRISWDKVNNTLRALPGSRQLAVTSGGTIADRGYYGVYLEDGTTRVGEVDEEFIYESRNGDTFILGTNVWRIRDISADRVTVAPAPGEPARMPFWRGEGIGRAYALGIQIGEFRREFSTHLDSTDCLGWLQRSFPIDHNAAWNIMEYFRKQRDATSVIPHNRMLVLEGFRDELGDPRLVLHSPFGRGVNGLLGLVLSRRLHVATGVEPQMLYNDDGILLRCSNVDELPLSLMDGLTLREAEEVALEDILTSPLFGGQFRQNAARALLMPRTSPGKRTPLWLQRLRAGDLLQVVRKHEDFPIVIETMREVLDDILDFAHFKEIASGIEQGTIATRTVQTETPSPFASSLLFDFIAVYMYEWDQPRADSQSRYLSINRELLSEVIDLDRMRDLLRMEAVDHVVHQLQRTADGYRARSPEELLEMLIRLGDLTEAEVRARCASHAGAMLSILRNDGRAIEQSIGGERRWIAGEDAPLYARASEQSNAMRILMRYLQGRGPVTAAEVAHRYGYSMDRASKLLHSLTSSGEVEQGHFLPAPDAPVQWCYRPNLSQIHRQTIHILRHEIQPCSMEEFTHFLFHWQHVSPHTRESGEAGLESLIEQLQGIPLPVGIWERDVLMLRMRNFSPDLLARATATGAIIWVGSGPGKMRCVVRGNGGVFLCRHTGATNEPTHDLSEPGDRVLEFLRINGASFFADIRSGARLSLAGLNQGLSELFWAGLITNDIFEEITSIKRSGREGQVQFEPIQMVDPRHNPHKGRMMQSVRRALKQVPGWSGRWSLVHSPAVLGDPLSMDEAASRQAYQLLQRYGIVAREFHRREELLPWGLVATELQRLELRGEIRRGYFVEGLSGMQYAVPTAVELLRQVRAESGTEPITLLNACDPANPFGPSIDLRSNHAIRFSRIPGNYLAFSNGVPVLLFEHHGSRIWSLRQTSEDELREALVSFLALLSLPERLRPFKEVIIESWDGTRPAASPAGSMLRSLGFTRESNQTMRFDAYSRSPSRLAR